MTATTKTTLNVVIRTTLPASGSTAEIYAGLFAKRDDTNFDCDAATQTGGFYTTGLAHATTVADLAIPVTIHPPETYKIYIGESRKGEIQFDITLDQTTYTTKTLIYELEFPSSPLITLPN